MSLQGIDTQAELFKSSLAKLKELAGKQKKDFLKKHDKEKKDWLRDHEREIKQQEKDLRKKFRIPKSNIVDMPSESAEHSEKTHKKPRKKAKKLGGKRGVLKKHIFEVAEDLTVKKIQLTTKTILNALATKGIPATRAQVYLILHRSEGKGIRVKRAGSKVGFGEETIFELEEKEVIGAKS